LLSEPDRDISQLFESGEQPLQRLEQQAADDVRAIFPHTWFQCPTLLGLRDQRVLLRRTLRRKY